MSTPLWQPSKELLTNSNITRFMQYVQQRYALEFHHYNDFYHWSIDQPSNFWECFADFSDVIFSKPADSILVDPKKMPGAKWFVGAELNFAENLLRHRSIKTALIFHNENSERTELTYAELFHKVEQVAHSLREMGVTLNDRVAGFLPNRPETIIAMLATTSIGAIWSSCSPDFGYHGVYDRFRQIEPKVLFATDGHFYGGKAHSALDKVSQLMNNLPSVTHTILVPNIYSGELKNSVMWETLLTENTQPLQFEQLPFDHPVYILFSSGTTGVPKCIVHGAGGTLLQHLKEHQLHTNLTANDVFTYFTTCGWMMWNWLVSGLATGATLVLYDGSPLHPTSGRLFELIDHEAISVFGTSAKFITAIEKSELTPSKNFSLESLHTILSTGSPLVPQNYRFVYESIKPDVQLCSISGGTDIISCFALGNPILPVYSGELQSRGLGMRVEIFNQDGQSVYNEKGELVCTAPFPSMPVFFWNDTDGQKYHNAYFNKFDNVWAHGDYAQLTENGGIIIYGRSDTVLNPGGVRIGTAEIYRQVERFPEVDESIVIGQPYNDDVRVILFLKMHADKQLDNQLKNSIRQRIKENISPHHVPKKIIAVQDIPRTISGKIAELAVKNIICGDTVENIDALANPESLDYYKNIPELGSD